MPLLQKIGLSKNEKDLGENLIVNIAETRKNTWRNLNYFGFCTNFLYKVENKISELGSLMFFPSLQEIKAEITDHCQTSEDSKIFAKSPVKNNSSLLCKNDRIKGSKAKQE